MNFDFSIYKYVIFFISLYFIFTRITKFLQREQGQSLFKLLVTLVIWSGIFIFAAFPDFSRTLSNNLGLGQNLNTLIFTGFIVVFVLIFKLLSIIESMEKNITDLVRREALEKLSNE